MNKYQDNANAAMDPQMLEAINKAHANRKQEDVLVEAEEIKPKVPEGTYLAVVTNAQLYKDEPGKFGINDFVKITYDLMLDNDDEAGTVSLNAKYWKSQYRSSAFVIKLSELLQKDPRQGFSVNELHGQVCEVTIKHNPLENGFYANVTGVKRIEMNEGSFKL